MSIYSGFPLRDMESKYNITLFDLVLTLGTRVAATIRNSKLLPIIWMGNRDGWKRKTKQDRGQVSNAYYETAQTTETYGA